MFNLTTDHKITPESRLSLKKSLDFIKSTKSDSGFYAIPTHDKHFTESETLAHQLKEKYQKYIVVGVGGSSMGGRALVEIAKSEHITFLDNVDLSEISDIIKKHLNFIHETAFIIISKSGSTIEILLNYSTLHEQFKLLANFDIIKNSFFISEKNNNPIANFASEHKRPLLEIPVNIGGRFSVLTPVGLLIAAISNYNIKDIRLGAEMALDDEEKIIQFADLFLESFKRKENISLFWFYNSYYRWFGGWIQQLWAESLGKKMDRNGQPAFEFSTPMTSIGACDQHSILQQVIEGPKNKFVCVFRFKHIESNSPVIKNPLFSETQNMKNKKFGDLIKAEALATQKGLDISGVSTLLFEFENFNPETLGYLFMSFQIVVSALAEAKNVNAFDQPGVALGKKLIPEFL